MVPILPFFILFLDFACSVRWLRLCHLSLPLLLFNSIFLLFEDYFSLSSTTAIHQLSLCVCLRGMVG